MNSSSFTPSSIIFFVTVLLLSTSLPRYVFSDDERFRRCAPSECGGKIVDYPFWGNQRPDYCGLDGFKVDCNGGDLTLDIRNLKYSIIGIRLNPPFLMINRTNFLSSNCPEAGEFFNTSLDRTPFDSTPEDEMATLYYNCNTLDFLFHNSYTCLIGNTYQQGYLLFPGIGEDALDELRCNIGVVIPVLKTAIRDFFGGMISVQEVVNRGFEVIWHIDDLEKQCMECVRLGGRCGHNRTLNRFSCFCPDNSTATSGSSYLPQPPAPVEMSSPKRGSLNRWRMKVFIGSLCGGIGILFATIVCYIRRRNNFHVFLMNFLQSEKVNHQDIESFMRNYGSLIPTRYSYADVKKITNLFKEKLGQGGFGSVYKGKLPDGRLVAVKILNETKGNGEEFINEVASISRTSHINIVSMLGFCLERRKRALIYEFMPNGSLETYIGDESHRNIKQHLELEKLYQIAIGVARGLEYLHRGCNTRIVHFDIKPHNILLDKDFCPKISDFGLAKLCTREKSTLSMLGARGTVGYIAPEVFSRNFGGVSHKSDVYSYGMVLLEMVGEKRKDENVASDASEKYFPYWVYKHLELNEFGFLGAIYVEDIEIVRKMAIVGLWCIQMNPSHRPSMSKVIEMLEGSIEILKIPPIPFLSSSPRSASDTCTLSLS